MITSLGIKAKVSPHKYKNSRYAVGNLSKKDLSNIIKEFQKLPYESYENKRPKQETIDSYFYLARHLSKCMMRAGALNSHGYPVRTEINSTKHIPTLHVCSTNDIKL